MKKIGLILTAVIVGVLVTGCGEKEKKYVCTLSTNDAVNGYKMESEYNIFAKGDVVTQVKTKETVKKTSEDSNVDLEAMKKSLEDTYNKMNDTYKGYNDIKVTVDNDVVTASVSIDYTKMDLDKLVKDQPTMKNYMNSKSKLTVEGIQSLYKATGATCKEAE